MTRSSAGGRCAQACRRPAEWLGQSTGDGADRAAARCVGGHAQRAGPAARRPPDASAPGEQSRAAISTQQRVDVGVVQTDPSCGRGTRLAAIRPDPSHGPEVATTRSGPLGARMRTRSPRHARREQPPGERRGAGVRARVGDAAAPLEETRVVAAVACDDGGEHRRDGCPVGKLRIAVAPGRVGHQSTHLGSRFSANARMPSW